MKVFKPNFLFLGPDKTGSTWIYHLLKEHHEIYVPKIKDLYFYDKNYQKGMEWYFRYFRNAQPYHKRIGELSHDYIHSEVALKRIKKDLGAIKTMVCYRNPIDRSVSHYLYLLHSGIVRGRDIENELLQHDEVRLNSLYLDKLYMWRQFFPDGLLLRFAELKNDSISFGNRILRYLECSEVSVVPLPKRVSSAPRIYLLSKMIKFGGITLRKLGLLGVLGSIKESEYREFAFKQPDLILREKVRDCVSDLWASEFELEFKTIKESFLNNEE